MGLTAVKAAGLVDTLSGAGTFTVFAPTNDAFAKIDPTALNGLIANPEALKKVLLRHVLPNEIKAGEIPLVTTDLRAVSGDKISVDKNGNSVQVVSGSDTAQVVTVGISASNGIIHVIDTVLVSKLDSIAEIVIGNPSFSTLLTAVKAAGLVDTLSGAGTFTVFAPTNDAFDKVGDAALNGLLANPEALKKVLLRHVLPNEIEAVEIPLGTTDLRAVSGDKISVDNNGNSVQVVSGSDTAQVVTVDIPASNGIIHVIDTVLVSKLDSIAEIVIDNPNFSTLLAAVKVAGLVDTLSGPGTFTVFAPTNDAFAKVGDADLNGLLANPEALKKVLLRHALPNEIKAGEIPPGSTEVTAASEDKISVNSDGESVQVESSSASAIVVTADISANNGIIHVIDTVI